ncbi:hypothetical protein CCYA_CCYA02G0494 [Cyanidiococcus yangmingshanensis]|uniref:Uncharacterized protein n=1 Tax=Cyanidiococcus yangmingshanensis TaxID=2690220 RepID=A0A7J7IPJ0_9RHOD|nr:hypothetical protein F1559_004835 [Cyanidiococcus yangmingshanensis]KAK4529637.1 hypothetical protein CCYA_CCYA02G0494 [Cyanidiococcus yangmingshanensis]
MDTDAGLYSSVELDRLHDPAGYRTRALAAGERRADCRGAWASRPLHTSHWTLQRGSEEVPVLQLQRGNTQVLVTARMSASWRVTVQVPSLCTGHVVTNEAVILTEYLERLFYPIVGACRPPAHVLAAEHSWRWDMELTVLSADGGLRDLLLLGIQQMLPLCIRQRQRIQGTTDKMTTNDHVQQDAMLMNYLENLVPCSFLVVKTPINLNQGPKEASVRVMIDPTADEEDTDSTMVTAIFYDAKSQPEDRLTVYFLECSGKPLSARELETSLAQVSAHLLQERA